IVSMNKPTVPPVVLFTLARFGGEAEGDRRGQKEAIVCNQLDSCTLEHLPHSRCSFFTTCKGYSSPAGVRECGWSGSQATRALTMKGLHPSVRQLLDARASSVRLRSCGVQRDVALRNSPLRPRSRS